MKHVDLSTEQEQAADMLVEWARYRSGARGRAGAVGRTDDRVRALRGLAGTGKTTTGAEVARRLVALGTRVAVVAPTGKAAHVLRTKGIAATTIHAAAYRLIDDGASSPTFELRPGVQGDPDPVCARDPGGCVRRRRAACRRAGRGSGETPSPARRAACRSQ